MARPPISSVRLCARRQSYAFAQQGQRDACPTDHPCAKLLTRFPHKGGVIVFGMKGKTPGGVARALAERGGIGVRSGCHCAHLTIKRLLGVPPWAEQLQRLMLSLMPGFNLPGPKQKSFEHLDFLKTFIPENIAIGRAPSQAKPLVLIDPYVPGAIAFRSLCTEILNVVG